MKRNKPKTQLDILKYCINEQGILGGVGLYIVLIAILFKLRIWSNENSLNGKNEIRDNPF